MGEGEGGALRGASPPSSRMVAMKRVVGYLLAQQQPNGELIGHNVRIETYIIFTIVR